MKPIPIYIRDDMVFLNHIVPNEVNEEALLISYDVTSVYTNIPHELGIEAVKYWMDKYPHMINSCFQHKFIIESLKIV